MPIASTNPATGETVRTFEPLSAEQLEQALQRAAAAVGAQRRTSLDQRASWLRRAAELLESEAEDLGHLMTIEMGKPIAAAVAEAQKCAWACRYYADHGAVLLADEPVETDAQRSFIRYEPLGIVLAVMPWNFPFWQVFRFAAPALMAGNVGLLKHASNVPQCALAIEDLLRRAGVPEGFFQSLLIGSDAVSDLIADPRIAAVTLTGSEGAGMSVGAAAGKALKKSVLELGGSDPFIVMPSADLDAAVRTAVKARTINNGQSCIAAKRFIIAEEIYTEFEQRFVAAMEALIIGDPLDTATEIGPLASLPLLHELDDQVQRSLAAGARLLTGGQRIADLPGAFYAPTVLADVPQDAPAFAEELFGPVAVVFRARDIDHAIEIANSTSFGLGAAAWTNDSAEQERFISEIAAGQVFINSMVASDPRLPFGGIKRSGYGRELSSHGLREFVNIKSIWVADTSADQDSVRTAGE